LIEQEDSALNPQPSMIAEDPALHARENVVEIEDSWADKIARTLAQTEIGRMLEGSSPQQDATTTQEDIGNSQLPSARTNRIAG
jgi:hypothetical protein